MVVANRFDDSAGHRFHVAAGQPAVSVQALIDDHHVPRLLEQRVVVHGQPAADVHQGVLLAAHRAAVGVGAEFLEDFRHRPRLVARLALLDKIGVFDGARGVEHDAKPVPVGQFADGADVRHRNRLPAGHVDRGRNADVGDVAGADLLDEVFNRLQIDVALERVFAGRIVPLGNDDVDEGAAGEFLVQPGSGEVHVARHQVARLDEQARQDVLGAASLVGGHEVAIAVVLSHRVFQVVEIAAARVGFVAEHHAGPLPIAHGVGAAIGEQVDVNVFRAEEERVVARFSQRFLALGARKHFDGLDHFDFPGFRPRAACRSRCRHCCSCLDCRTK